MTACLVLLCGFTYDALGVFWVHFSERGRAGETAACSMVQGAVLVTGIFETVRDFRMAAFLVAGYGLGTFVAVTVKKRRAASVT